VIAFPSSRASERAQSSERRRHHIISLLALSSGRGFGDHVQLYQLYQLPASSHLGRRGQHIDHRPFTSFRNQTIVDILTHHTNMSSVTDIIRPYFTPHDFTSLWVTDNRVKNIGNWPQGVYHAASVASALAGDIHKLVEGDIKVVEIGWWNPGYGQQRQHVAVRMDMDTDTKNRVFAMRCIWDWEIPGLVVTPSVERKTGWYGKISTTNLTLDELPVVPYKGLKQDRRGGYIWTWFLDKKKSSAQAKLHRLEMELDQGEGDLVNLDSGLHDLLK
jgi:hypothetical protein